jgi:hypothetical protein
MRRSIDGKVYDEDTAQHICDISEGRQYDFDGVIANLYVTKKGNFFIAGYGGATTRFKGWVGSKSLISIGLEEARTYCEKFAPDEVEEYFEVEEA